MKRFSSNLDEFRFVFLIFAVLCFLAAAAPADDEYPAFSCKGTGTMNHDRTGDFRCLATNTGQEQVDWTLYATDNAGFASGPSASFPAPREWTVIEMRVQDMRVRAMVRYSSEKKCVVFMQYEEPQ